MERIKTHIERMDERLEGGIPKGTVSLICGTPGCMKSSLAYSILYKNALEKNLKGLYMTLEQEIESLKEQMKTLGMAKESQNLTIVDYKLIHSELGLDKRFDFNPIKKVGYYIDELIKRSNFDLLVIDPLNALYSLAAIKNPRSDIYQFFAALRKTGITSLVISEMHQGDTKFGKYGVEDFLSDAIIHLDFRREKDILERYIGIIKMRFTNHNLQYFPLFYNKDRFVIYTKEELEL